jgi:hypothetical protein
MRDAGFRYDIIKMCEILSESSMAVFTIQKYACEYIYAAQMVVQNFLPSTYMEGSHHLVMLFFVSFEDVIYAFKSVEY